MADATPCLTCDLVRRRDAGDAPLWDNIHRTAHWDVVHSYNTSLPGWLVLVARRHVAAIDELTEHPHVHFHVIPRMAAQPADRRGPRVFAYLGVPDEERVSEERMNAIAVEVRRLLGL
jgi:diadenosine tetraphosphate (Ap4A) HIT family hydrolase